jgi:hypothetical protein
MWTFPDNLQEYCRSSFSDYRPAGPKRTLQQEPEGVHDGFVFRGSSSYDREDGSLVGDAGDRDRR